MLFATLKIIDRNFIENFITVPFLSKKNAVKARRIIQGLVISSRENIDLSQIHDTELVQKLEALGSVSTTPEL